MDALGRDMFRWIHLRLCSRGIDLGRVVVLGHVQADPLRWPEVARDRFASRRPHVEQATKVRHFKHSTRVQLLRQHDQVWLGGARRRQLCQADHHGWR